MTTAIVLTGGPGAGKTAVIEHIAHLGFRCCEEVGRQVIQSQVEQGGKAVPWQDKTAFRDRMLSAEQANHARVADHKGTVFFDRGLVDIYGYSRLEGLMVPSSLVKACDQRSDTMTPSSSSLPGRLSLPTTRNANNRLLKPSPPSRSCKRPIGILAIR